jgi:hypothetical protein
LLAGSILILGVVATLSLTGMKPDKTFPGARIASSASAPPFVLDASIMVLNYTATNFTWMSPVTFNFSIWSILPNTTVVFITIACDALEPFILNQSIHFLENIVPITVSLNPLAMPGDHVVNITFSRGNSTASFTTKLWLGSNIIITAIMLFAVLGIALGIFAKYGGTKKSASSGSGSSSAAGMPASGASDDDTSTATYVDQSRAPAGRIFCPECKKVIEEGSIFCPECGTRIPRYLRYHP